MAKRHTKTIKVEIPDWVDDAEDKNPCLSSVARDAYTARAFAKDAGAETSPACAQIMQAGKKSLAIMESEKTAPGKRCAEGDRAARKFWEAKICARRRKG